MTRPTLSALVTDGEKVFLRLQADRRRGQPVAHVDWLRFTCFLRDAPMDERVLFPEPLPPGMVWAASEDRLRVLQRHLDALEEQRLLSPAVQAYTLGEQVARELGESFTVGVEPLKGHDFYAKRFAILLDGCEVGWVGFGASSESPRQRAQTNTLHVNLYGHACTFAEPGWRERMADLIDQRKAWVTRVDLAVDFFDGYPGGMPAVVSAYESGACDVRGKRPSCNMVGDWVNGHSRSFYVGSRAAGKQTNVYEKGDQLYGVGQSPWVRFELRYGHKQRELPSDVLRRPSDFFAGASDWHAAVIEQAGAMVQAEPIPCEPRLAVETVDAEIKRNLRWIARVAAPSLAVLFEYGSERQFLDLVEGRQLPGRLAKFSRSRIQAAFGRIQETARAFSAAPGNGGPVPAH